MPNFMAVTFGEEILVKQGLFGTENGGPGRADVKMPLKLSRLR
jgi:hypothetical protein